MLQPMCVQALPHRNLPTECAGRIKHAEPTTTVCWCSGANGRQQATQEAGAGAGICTMAVEKAQTTIQAEVSCVGRSRVRVPSPTSIHPMRGIKTCASEVRKPAACMNLDHPPNSSFHAAIQPCPAKHPKAPTLAQATCASVHANNQVHCMVTRWLVQTRSNHPSTTPPLHHSTSPPPTRASLPTDHLLS